jgi:hypothetical protein
VSKPSPHPSILTGNRLGDGAVVFLAADGRWVESIDAAAIARSSDETQALEAHGVHDAARNLVVEPYLAEVREAGGRLIPVRARERVRVDGPSILDDVPGYVPSPHASPTALRTPPAWGEGKGEGRPQIAAPASAPHPNPLPVKNGERESRTEVA